MKQKTAAVKKKASAKAAPAPKKKAKPASWADTMKKALESKRPAGGFPDQPKPRDSGVQKVRKNAF
ncbi:MAG: hypothetical protein ABW171_05985 [Steroidobacter sp.]